ncbi:CARDB domain-containing protein [Candidatus Bipolaricaulota bacterium]
MRRAIRGLVAVLVVFSMFVFVAWAQNDVHFALEELHLISWEYLPEGHPSHTGPVSTAIVMAWHAARGYPLLLPDLNHDGRINEDDTVLLAQEFAEEMAADLHPVVYDPYVVDQLATYVGEQYPNEFLLLIFDPSFADEYLARMGRGFDANGYPEIEILLLGEPDYEAYANLLDELRPGIVGYGDESHENRFSVSRSREQSVGTDGGPVDLVNTDREALGPELVWDTELRQGGERWWFTSPEWIPFEIFIVLIPKDPEASSQQGDTPGTPPPGSGDGGPGDDETSPPGSADWGSGSQDTDPPPGSSSWSGDESSDLAISMWNSHLEKLDAAHAAPGEQVRYILSVWHTGPDSPRNLVAELTIPFGVQIDWIGGNPVEVTGWPGRHFVWSIPDGTLQTAVPSAGMTPGVDTWIQELQITVDEGVCKTIDFAFETSSTTPDPNLPNNEDTLTEVFGPCSGPGSSESDPPAGDSSWSGDDESSDLLIEMIRVGMGDNPRVDAAPGDQVLYNLYVWQLGPDIPRNVTAELRLPAGVSLDWIEGNPTYDWREGNPLPGATSPENGLVRWEIDEMTLQQATPGVPGTPGVDMWLQWLQVTVGENTCGPIQYSYSVTSTTPDPDLTYNTGTLTAQIGPCDPASEPGGEPGGDPAPITLPNLWVTNVTGCWEWSDDGQEHVIATITGIVHNGGQASASGVRARITAGGVSTSKYVGTIAAGGHKTVTATIDIGAYDNVSWVVPTSIKADPYNAVEEADESNNTTDSSFPESSECH